MIRVERDQNADDGTPIVPIGTWSARAATNTTEAINEGPTHQVTDLYKEDVVRAALEKLFRNKCAYCESHGMAGFPWDVEHYRPKGRIAEDETHPGYYWLAYTWTNLYPSCVFCNRPGLAKDFEDSMAVSSCAQSDRYATFSPAVAGCAAVRKGIIPPAVDSDLSIDPFTPGSGHRATSSKGERCLSAYRLSRISTT